MAPHVAQGLHLARLRVSPTPAPTPTPTPSPNPKQVTDTTLEIASPQLIRLDEAPRDIGEIYVSAPAPARILPTPSPNANQTAPSKVEMKADLLDDTSGKRATGAPCCVIA